VSHSIIGGQPAAATGQYDLRLAPAAAGCWAICLIAWWTPVAAMWLMIFAGVCTVSAVMVIASRRARHFSMRWGWWITALAVGICALSVGIAIQPHRYGPLAESAREAVVVRADVTTQAEVQLSDGGVAGSMRTPPRYTVRAHLHALESRLGTWSVSAPITLRLLADDSHLAPGSRVTVRARVTMADYTAQAAAVLRALDPVDVEEPPSVIARTVHAVRVGLRDSVEGTAPDAGALVLGLTIGDESTQPEGLSEAMRISGLAHLTAVSGGNVAIVLGVVIIIGRLLAVGVTWQTGIGAVVLGCYVLVVGPDPSVLRAAGMGTVTVIALLAGGPRRGLSALCATIVVLLILAPSLAVSLGFALSVSATAGLLLLAPILRRVIRAPLQRWPMPERFREALADAIALTMAAQITTAPILASLGRGLSLVSVPANVLAAPAVAPVTVLGVLAAATAPVLPPLAAVFSHIAAPFAAWIAWLARTFSGLSVSTLAWPGGWLGAFGAIATLLGITAAVIIGRSRQWPLRTLAVSLIAVVAVIWLKPPDRAGWPPPGWIAVVCDVGQGDGMVISTGQDRAIVVDAGPDPGLIDACLADLGVRHVEALVLTHFHADHVEGIRGVGSSRGIDRILVSPLAEPREQAQRVASWAQDAAVPVEQVWAGATGRSGSPDQPVVWKVLWPARIIEVESMPNNASVVLDITVAGTRLLLLGDVEPAAQVALRAARGPGGFDVVKVAHHGSRFQDPLLASWTAGRIAVISVGADNRYGHPAEETLEAWQSVAARIMRTDVHGDVAIVVDGGQLGVVTRR
jgi:competence protein ComEC